MQAAMQTGNVDREALVRICQEAGRIGLSLQADVEVELKPDGSIVTNADRLIETYLRDILPRLAPGSVVWGEEFGYAEDLGDGVWLVDPVDGTSNYAFGSPLWGVSVAFAHSGKLEVGVVDLPGLQETYSAARGQGAWCDGEPMPAIQPGGVAHHELVSICGSTIRALQGHSVPGKPRCTGAFVIDGAFTARQRFRGLVGMNEYLYDVAASVLLCQELGAEVRYWDGSSFDVVHLLQHNKIAKPWIMFPTGA